jgi:hypothetical protein
MNALIDLTGQRFGRLVAIRRAPAEHGQKPRWECICDCGKAHVGAASHLRRGGIKSCGCLQVDNGRAKATHGHSRVGEITPTYRTWVAMVERCTKPQHRSFANYGGRGIVVCLRWRKFENFLSDMGERPSPQYSIDRIDPNGDYKPDNCRWATSREQGRNRRTNHVIEIDGERMTVIEAAERFGVKDVTIRARLRAGKSAAQAVGIAP